MCPQCGRPRFDPWVGKIPWRRKWQPPPVFPPGKSHGRRSLAGYSPWGGSQSRTRLSDFHSLTLRPLGSITTSEWVSLAAPAQKRQEPVLPMVEPQPLHSTAGWLVLSGEHLLCVRHFPSTHPQRPPHSEAGPASSPWDRKV